MGDIDDRRPDPAVQPQDLAAHLGPEPGVECRERLIEQKDLRLLDDRAPDGDALLLATRQLRRLHLQLVADRQQLGDLPDPAVDLVAGKAFDLQRITDIVADAHVGEKGDILKHHADVSLLGRQMGDIGAVEEDAPAGCRLESRHHPQRRGLAAARRPDEGKELSRADIERQVVNGRDPAVAGAEGLADVVQCEGDRHECSRINSRRIICRARSHASDSVAERRPVRKSAPRR